MGLIFQSSSVNTGVSAYFVPTLNPAFFAQGFGGSSEVVELSINLFWDRWSSGPPSL